MTPIMVGALFSLALFAGMLAMIEVGWRLGRKETPGSSGSNTSAIEGAVFGLFGLLIAFTFSGATSRFDARRQLIVTEANAIGTAWLRLDLLPAEARPALRDDLRRYLDARIEAFRALPDVELAGRAANTATALQGTIWERAVAAIGAPGMVPGVSGSVVAALNDMFDITTTRAMAMQHHPPAIIYVMLFALALASALLAGFALSAGARRRVHSVLYAAVVAFTVYVAFDIEFPRQGLIRVDAFDEVLVQLRASMQEK